MIDSEGYEPFGDEWKKEMMKWSKADLIDLLADNLREKKELKRRAEDFIRNPITQNLSILESFLMEINRK